MSSWNIGYPVNRMAPLNRGLVSWWIRPPVLVSNARWLDLLGKNHGVLTGGPIWAGSQSRAGGWGALKLDGTDDYVSLGTATELNIQGEMVFSCWHKANGDYTTNQAFIASSPDGGAANYVVTFGFTANKFEFWNTAAGPNLASVASISDDEWRFYTAVRSGSSSNWTLDLYINGILDNTTAGLTTNPNGTTADMVALGRFGGFNGYYVNGYMDDARLYNRSFTANEVLRLYQASKTGYKYELNWIEDDEEFDVAAAVGGGTTYPGWMNSRGGWF